LHGEKEMEENETNRNGKGRPSKYEQLEIERTLRDTFRRGLLSHQAVTETGYSPNTVKKYYGKFYKEIRDLEGPNFAQECMNRRISACLGLDQEILKQEKVREELELKSKTGGTQDIHLYKLQTSLSNSIADLIEKRLAIANSPTYRDMLEAMKEVEKQK
jgi:predicted transcriptional regulator